MKRGSSPRNKILASSLLIEAFLYEEQTRRGVSIRHFDEFSDVADHCTVCHKCLNPCPVDIDFGDVSIAMRKQEEMVQGAEAIRASGHAGPIKVLTSCPSCLQGLARYDDDAGTQADYIVVELARHLLGERLDGRLRTAREQRRDRARVALTQRTEGQIMPCVFCEEAGGEILWEDDFCRAVWAYEADYPGLCRVIWDRHVKEMTDLDATEHASRSCAWCSRSSRR